MALLYFNNANDAHQLFPHFSPCSNILLSVVVFSVYYSHVHAAAEKITLVHQCLSEMSPSSCIQYMELSYRLYIDHAAPYLRVRNI
jgi:hypothetical protein